MKYHLDSLSHLFCRLTKLVFLLRKIILEKKHHYKTHFFKKNYLLFKTWEDTTFLILTPIIYFILLQNKSSQKINLWIFRLSTIINSLKYVFSIFCGKFLSIDDASWNNSVDKTSRSHSCGGFVLAYSIFCSPGPAGITLLSLRRGLHSCFCSGFRAVTHWQLCPATIQYRRM